MKTAKIRIVFFLFIIGYCSGQTPKKIFFTSIDGNRSHKKLLLETKMESMILFYQNEIVIDDALNFDPKTLEASIKLKFPSKYQEGYAVLDWEGKAGQILQGIKIVSEAEFETLRNNYISSLKFAKKLRPNVKWSFYNFPGLDFGKVSKGHDDYVRKNLMPILVEMDFLTPSIYVLVDNGEEKNDLFAYTYAESNTEYAIKIGKEINKRVFPFIWHRYGSPNKDHGLIEPLFFENFVQKIGNAKFEGQEIDGIIWWECEDYVYNNRATLKNANEEYRQVKDKNQHIETVYRDYYKIIENKINK